VPAVDDDGDFCECESRVRLPAACSSNTSHRSTQRSSAFAKKMKQTEDISKD